MFKDATFNNGEGSLQNHVAVPAVLTKVQLIEEVSRITELPRKEAVIIVEAILDSMARAIKGGDKVEIRRFAVSIPGHAGHASAVILRVEVPAKRIPFFKPSKREVVMKF